MIKKNLGLFQNGLNLLQVVEGSMRIGVPFEKGPNLFQAVEGYYLKSP